MLDGMWRVLVVWGLLMTSASADPINAVIGDASWTTGDPETGGEAQRIETHLVSVRAQLAAAEPAGLSVSQRVHRAAALEALGRYIERGLFPRRTGDPYAGRRPRFIDDRGVHCAVAQLIADSGHPALARAIASRFEYAYVPDIAAASDELRAWATEHGFTVTELATIQPQYGAPPTKEGTKREIEDAVNRITIACAALHAAAQPRVKLQVRGNARGQVTVTAPENTAFAKCIARQAAEAGRGRGAWDEEPRAFAFDMTLSLPSPQDLFAKAVSDPRDFSGCLPRPGPIPREATIRGASTKDGLTVSVQTSPRNEEAEACLADQACRQWGFFKKGVWSLSATRTLAIASQLAPAVKRSLSSLAGSAVAQCRQDGMSGAVTVKVTAQPDDADFTVIASPGTEPFLSCLRDKLRATLKSRVSVPRSRPDGTVETYVRIDSEVSASATVRL